MRRRAGEGHQEGPPCAVEFSAPRPCWPPPSWAPRAPRAPQELRELQEPARPGGTAPAGSAHATAAAAHTLPGGYRHLVVIYEENHSFDNLYGSWGRSAGPGRRPGAGAPEPSAPRSRRTARRTAACCRTTSTSPRPPLARPAPTPRTGCGQRLHQRPVHASTTTSGPTDKTCPPPGVFAAERGAEGLPGRAARRLHPRPGAPLLPGAVPDRRRQAGPLRHRLRRGRPDHGPLRHHAAADLPLPARARAPRTT